MSADTYALIKCQSSCCKVDIRPMLTRYRTARTVRPQAPFLDLPGGCVHRRPTFRTAHNFPPDMFFKVIYPLESPLKIPNYSMARRTRKRAGERPAGRRSSDTGVKTQEHPPAYSLDTPRHSWSGHLPCVYRPNSGCNRHNPGPCAVYYNPRLPRNDPTPPREKKNFVRRILSGVL